MKIPQQLPIRPALPVILNNVDYQLQETQLIRMDELLRLSGIEEQFVEVKFQEWLGDRDPREINGETLLKQRQRSRTALRCMILMSWRGLAYRVMSVRLGESELYRWFCQLDRLGEIRVPSKSEVGRFMEMGDDHLLRRLNGEILKLASLEPQAEQDQALKLKNEIELETVWLDSTALKVDIHFPADWVLLRDAVRTLMKATLLIRDHGVKHRMAPPEEFLRLINKQCMEMSAGRRKADSRKRRKQVLRKMKKTVQTVRKHALRHRDKLERDWEQTDWTYKQAMQVIGRIDNVLLQLPEAVEQAHARIIRGDKIENSKKILSLYEPDVNVIVRGKPESEIEFGNSLLIGEQEDGLIVDWQLHRKSAPNDSRQVEGCLERIEQAHGSGAIKSMVGDRQFDSPGNRSLLKERGIYNALCPRSPKELANKSKSAKFQKAQRRRAQTEARIGILKNDFLDAPVKRRGFENREKQVAWSVLTHNLWLLTRLDQAEEEPAELPKAA